MTNLPASGRLLNTSDFLLNFHIFIPFTEEKDRVWLPESWPSLDQEDPWRRERQPTPVFLPGEVHGQRSQAGYSPWDRKASDMTVRLSLFTHCKRRGNSKWLVCHPVFTYCQENLMWWKYDPLCLILLGWPKYLFEFSITSKKKKKNWKNFLANPILYYLDNRINVFGTTCFARL